MRKLDLELRPGDDIAGRRVIVLPLEWPFEPTEAVAIAVEERVALGLGPMIRMRFDEPLAAVEGCYEHGMPEPHGSSYVKRVEQYVKHFDGEQEIRLVHGTGCKVV